MSAVDSYILEKSPLGPLESKLRSLSVDEKIAISPILSLLPSVNHLSEILELATEVSKRDQQSLSKLLSERELKEISKNDSESKKDRTKRIVNYLKTKRYPVKNALLEKIAVCKNEIAKETGLKIELPKDFEGDSLSLNLKFSSSKGCKELSEKLAKLSELSQTEEIFKILKGEF